MVIYTDLDGSLLDHHDYSHTAADGLLGELETRRIPVVLSSSKTRAEILSLRRELVNQHPFIVENGAAVLIPEGYFRTQPVDTTLEGGYWIRRFTAPRSHWLAMVEDLSAEFSGEYINFARLDVKAITSLTGLDPIAAQRAAKREYGEPVQWLGNNIRRQQFIKALENKGASILKGGRFLHVSGDCDKGRALQWLNTQFGEQPGNGLPVSIAIGDSQNDVAMLDAADHALIIRSPVNRPPVLSRSDHTLLSKACGPVGWDEAVRKTLRSLDLTKGSLYG